MTIFKLEPPICVCERVMDVSEVTRYKKIYLILKAMDDGGEADFYILYSIKNMKSFGVVYTKKPTTKQTQNAIYKYENGIIPWDN
jgi:hypothetical protein